MSKITLGTLITYNPWAVRADAALDEVAAQFETLGVHHVPVVDDDRRLVGIVSEAELLRARQQQRVIAVGAGGPEEVERSPESVADVMNRQFVVAGPHDSPQQVLQVLLAHRIHALPVVQEGCLIGMISSRDFLREFSYGELACSREPIAKGLKTPPEPLEPGTLIDEAYLAMQDIGASCLAVAQGGCPLGIVSLRDIVRARCAAMEEAGEELLPTQLPTVVRVMQRATPIRPAQRLFEAALVMVEENLPAAIVINQASRQIGLVTEDELLRAMHQEA